MIGFCYSFLVLLTIIQGVSYYLYNGRFHPFAMIVMPETKHNPMDEQVLENPGDKATTEIILDLTIKTNSDMESVL